MGYYQDLQRARADAEREFFTQNPHYIEIIDSIRSALPTIVLFLERECKFNKYTQALLSSFVRTAFVTIELIARSELTEAVTLNRKQVELLARLNELDKWSFEELSRKTPNVGNLKTKLKRLYSPYSESAHSSTYGAMSLLGFYENKKRRNHTLYPEFTENTEVIFENWIFIFFEFTLWVLSYKAEHIEGYSPEADEAEFQKIYDLMVKSGLKSKFKEKHGE